MHVCALREFDERPHPDGDPRDGYRWRRRLLAAAGSATPAAAQNERQGGRGGFLRRADANEDGIITRAEFDASAGDRFERRDDNSDGAITEDERQGRGGAPDSGGRSSRGGGRMMDADANEDGTITRAEFDASQNEMFARFDEDRSGAIESSELPARRTD
jgi:hypothetical protein